jgi:regulator of sigma E protease
MLDGGHLVVFGLEAARRRPLSQRARDRVQLVGLIVIALITVLALRNDVVRLLF